MEKKKKGGGGRKLQDNNLRHNKKPHRRNMYVYLINVEINYYTHPISKATVSSIFEVSVYCPC